MDSVIEEIYYATRGMRTESADGQEAEERLSLAAGYDETLKGLLKDNAKALEAFEGYKEALASCGGSEACEAFKEGFRFGLRVGSEAKEER